MQVGWSVIAAHSPMTAFSIVGAKWRREVPPSRRLTAREQSLPWAILSFHAHHCRVNHPGRVGTPTATVACSKVVKTGFYRAGPRRVIAARPVRKPHAAGAAGFPASALRRLPTARNSGESRCGAIESVSSNDHLLLNRRHQPATSS